jgi:hypothetical protein
MGRIQGWNHHRKLTDGVDQGIGDRTKPKTVLNPKHCEPVASAPGGIEISLALIPTRPAA